VVITTEEVQVVRRPNAQLIFKFEANWLHEEEFKRVVEEGWESVGAVKV
jgi:hypothetical protein